MEIAIGAARWVVGMALGLLSDGLLETWAASSELGSRIQALKTQLLLAHGILHCARGGADGIRNSALEELLLQLRQLAYSADDMLDELEYFRIQDKLEGTYETTDPDGQGLIHGLVLNARHTARDVASKLKLSSCSCAAAANHGDPGEEQEYGKQGCLSGACSRGGQKDPEINSSPPPPPPTNHGDQEADGGCMTKVIPASARDAARAVGKRLLPCYSLPSVHDNAPTSMDAPTVPAPKLKFDRVEMSKKMADIVKQLKSVCKTVSTILVCSNPLTITQGTALDRRPKTTPLIIERILYGRENLVKHVVDDITGKYSSDNLTVLSFVGPGGIGKTTFTQHIYDRVKSRFQVSVWVCVSHDFNASRLAKEIVEKIPKAQGEEETDSDEERIEKRLQSKQFLLVLDDMWTPREDEWKKLLAPFTKGGTKGNIVIVTTRIPAVAQMVATLNCSIKLERLGDEDCMLFFKACVFGDAQLWEDHSDLHDVGWAIVKKLKGFPLAVKTVGRILKRHLKLDYWTRVLERKEWEHEKSEDDIMPALKLSYNYLPFDLQQCFSHCALFPEDYKFTSQELIHLWLGLGLLGTSDENERTEDIGQRYLDELVDNGFFVRHERKNGYDYYVIHDLLHELAVNVSSRECLSIHSSNVRSIQIPASVHHLSVTVDDTDVKDRMTFENFKRGLTTLGKKLKAENLRTLMLFGEYHGSFAKTFGDLFREAKALRVIYLSGASYNVEDLLHKFSKLVHLRYLRIKDCTDYIYKASSLPSSISRFYNLMVLDVQECRGHLGFLRDMNNLVKIRHFLVHNDEVHSGICEVGKLKFLQELRRFEVKEEENGFELKQLEQLQQLQGSLGIYNLEKVKIKEADDAKLVQMNHLHGLTLAWDSNRSNKDPKQEECVLESLKPHSNLRKLCIEGHGGATCPTWLGVDLCIKNLESLCLSGVAWNVLPLVGKLPMVNEHGGECTGYVIGQGFQNLRRLELANIPRLKKWCGNHTSHSLSHLEELVVRGCSELIELPFSRSTCGQPKQEEEHMTWFPRLRTLSIFRCPKLLSFPYIPWTRALCDASIEVGSGFERLSYRKDNESKSILNIKGKDALDGAFWNVLAFDNLTELVELVIEGCPLVPLDHIRMLAALKTLRIYLSDKFLWAVEGESNARHQSAVESLRIWYCAASGKDLTRLLTHFPNLSELDIWSWGKVTGLGVVEQALIRQQEQQAAGEEEAIEEGLLLLPPQIQELKIRHWGELSLRKTAGGLQGLRSLRSLVILGCPKFLLSSNSSSSSLPFPSSLQKLYLEGVQGMWTLPPLANLNELDIHYCRDLRGETSSLQGNLNRLVVYKSPKFFSGSEPLGQYEQDLRRSFELQELRLETDDIAGALAAPICRLLSSSLTNLTLSYNGEVEVFTKEQEQALQSLTSLQELQIRGCGKLRSLPAGLSGLPNLNRLIINNCRAIRSLPKDGLPSSLQHLHIESCPAISSLPKDGLPSSLQHLHIESCPAISSLPKDGLPSSLQHLGIYACPAISSLPKDGLPGSLQHLEISDCPAISSLPSLPSSLQHLEIHDCPAISSLPKDGLPSSLQHLEISNCPAISSLPKDGLPSSLQYLKIDDCPAICSIPKAGLPSSLRLLDVRHGNSEELRTQCRKLKGTIPIIYDYGLY